MNFLVGMAMLMIANVSYGEPISTVDDVTFDVYKVGTFRTDDFPETENQNTKGITFNINLTIVDYIKWKNKVWTNGNDAKLYTVGWEYDIEAPLKYGISLFHYHHSQHSMDQPTLADKFPLRNYYGVRFNFISKGGRR